MRKRGRVFMVMFTCVFIGFLLSISEVQALTLRFAYVAPTGTLNHEVGEKFKENVESLSKGQMTVNLFPGGQLGDLPQMFGQLKMGTIDFFKTDVGVSAMVGGGKALGVVFAPYLFRDQNHFTKFCGSDIFKELMGEIEKLNGVKWIGLLADRSPRALTTRNKMVIVPDDCKGQKVRAPNVTSIDKILIAWGASIAVVSAPEMYSALKQKLVDGQENGIEIVYGMKLYEVQKHFTATDHVRSAEGLYANQKSWDSLDSSQQEIIMKATQMARAWGNNKLNEETLTWFDLCREKGMIITMPPLEPWIKASRKVIDEIDGKEWPKGLYDRVQGIK